MFFKSLLSLNKNINPSPALQHNPLTVAPKEIEFWIYNSVIKTLDAQLGISPIIEEYNGVNHFWEFKKDEKFSSPIR